MSKKLTTDEWKARVIEIHNGFYSYDKAEYLSGKKQITITCPVHGDFSQLAGDHYKYGCNECGIAKRWDKRTRNTTSSIIAKFKAVHGDRFNYSLVKFTNVKDDVTIICPIHGEFKQQPYNHINGSGCHKCAIRKTSEQAINDFKRIHGDTYDYTKTIYTRSEDDVVITCKIHGDFKQSALSHLKGKGCKDCSVTGFKNSKPAILYYLEIDGGMAYKIGITNNTIEQRFKSSDLSKIKVLNVVEYAHGGDAYKAEQKILKEFAYAKYTGDPLLSSGNTELFDRDVLLKA